MDNKESGRRKIKFLAVLFGFIPGLGHMYLGLMKKGTILMVASFGIIFGVILLSDSSDIAWMSGYLIPVVSLFFLSYSIFDSIVLTDKINSGEDFSDTGIEEAKAFKDLFFRKRRTIGWILVTAAVIILFNIFSNRITVFFRDYLGLKISAGALLIPILFLVFGIVLLIRGGGKR